MGALLAGIVLLSHSGLLISAVVIVFFNVWAPEEILLLDREVFESFVFLTGTDVFYYFVDEARVTVLSGMSEI